MSYFALGLYLTNSKEHDKKENKFDSFLIKSNTVRINKIIISEIDKETTRIAFQFAKLLTQRFGGSTKSDIWRIGKLTEF